MIAGVFIAPFFLFSGASGTLADRIDKAAIARWVKVAEIGIMTAGAFGLWLSRIPLPEARQQHGGSHAMVDDLDMRPMTYNGIVTASYALGVVLARRTERGERVGVLLPTSRGSW